MAADADEGLTLYNERRRQLRTADVLLFSGGGAVSSVIKKATASPWSHVGMCVRWAEEDILFCCESTTLSDVEDVVTGKGIRGVQLVPLSTRIRNYAGAIAVRRLLPQPGKPALRDERFRGTIARVRRRLHARPYEKNLLELARAAARSVLRNRVADAESLFCSELVSTFLQELRLLPQEQPANSFSPADFGAGGKVDELLRQGKRVRLGPELTLKQG